MNKQLRKRIFRTALYVWFAWFLAVWMAMHYFGFNRPNVPVPGEGRFYPFNDHGTVVYLTRAEHLLTVDLWSWYIVAGAIIGLITVKFGAWDRSGD
jgi:hypothetical protein